MVDNYILYNVCQMCYNMYVIIFAEIILPVSAAILQGGIYYVGKCI